MAQVKKFQNPAGPVTDTAAANPAGNPASETKKKYGRYIKNGITYEMTEERMKDLERHIMSGTQDDRLYLAEDYQRLLNGQDVNLDTLLNQRTGTENYDVLTDKQERRLQNGRPKEGFLNSVFNTKTHRFNKATE